MSSTLVNANNAPVYVVAHRRGESIHTYISSHGSTRRGKDQRHKDDAGSDGHCGPPRKCPRILNDWSQAQPHIDKNNRWRQYELAIEERFTTRSFPFRFFTTVIVGMSIANAWTMYQYHVNAKEFESFLAFVHEVAYDAMTNNYDEQHASSVSTVGFSSPSCSSLPSSASALQRTAEEKQHHAVPIRSIVGWAGAKQQRCSMCSGITAYCCLACSDAQSVVPMHPRELTFSGVSKRYGCIARHVHNPEASKRTVASAARSKALARRKRMRTNRGTANVGDV